MENINNLGEVFVKGQIINLKSAPMETIKDKINETEIEEREIKNQIFSLLETF